MPLGPAIRLGNDESGDCDLRVRFGLEVRRCGLGFGNDRESFTPSRVGSQFEPRIRDAGWEAVLIDAPESFEIGGLAVTQGEFHFGIVAWGGSQESGGRESGVGG